MGKALFFLIFAAFALQVRGLELESVKNALHNLFSDSEENEVQRFTCGKDGLYVNPLNCSSYIQCSNGIPHNMPCPEDLHFSNKSQRCEGKCDAHCDQTLACTCKWETCDKAVCFLPPKPGRCKELSKRFFYDKRQEKCIEFAYGGCRGNENNFPSEEDCKKHCESKKGERDAVFMCNLPKDKGPCDGLIPKYFYNSKTKQCERFIYGGCKGNLNNFYNKQDCEQKCLKKSGEEEMEEEAVDFKCHKDGLFLNKLNCSTYIQCTNGRPIVMPCPAGLHFSVKTQRCESTCDAHCDKALACKCEWKECGSTESCRLPSLTGPCDAHIQRYYFDFRSGQCKAFVYGGCLGNENNFERQEDCEKYCGSVIELCKLPKDVGPCRALVPRWWYDSSTKKCEKFKYGGCDGNANNFRTKENCEQRCEKKLEEEEEEIQKFKCPEDGMYQNKRNCSTFIQCTNGRPIVMPCPSGLHFSVKTQRCESPCDAHCDKTLACKCGWETCDPKKACLLPKLPGKCRGHFPRYYFDKRTGLCKLFIFGGCEGNENNFETKELCMEKCEEAVDICRLRFDRGPCKAAIDRWWYNSKTKKCEKFTYGGCQGNANNFKSAKECKQRCPKKSAADGVAVRAPDFECGKDGLYPLKRNCSAYIQCTNGRPVIMPCPKGLHFSVKTERCEQPCDAECDRTLACQCKWKTCSKENCLLTPGTGSCKVYRPRYYFSKSTGLCKPFIYSGCLGNENNFKTKTDCQKFCGNSINVCRFPSDPGHCGGKLQRYFFNSKKGKCEKFVYGGCGGNANNFKDQKECDLRCLKKAGEEEEVGPITCTHHDVYPNPDDCTQYIECFSNNTNIVHKCPANQHYSTSLKRCVEKCKAHCDLKLACECKWPNCKKGQSAVPKFCSLPVEKGPCKAHIPKYYFDSEEGECKEFEYGGCGGNMNSFFTKELCERTCKRDKGEEEEVDEGPIRCIYHDIYPDPDDCTQYIECFTNNTNIVYKCPAKQHYSVSLKRCVEICEAYCDPKLACECKWPNCKKGQSAVPEFCSLPVEKGPCKANITKYYFDSEEGECKEFEYGGCGGNRNSFFTKVLCERTCKKDKGEKEIEEEAVDFTCPKDGLFPNKLNCVTYIQCTNGRPVVMPCPDGLHFSVKTERCESQCDAHCERALACKCKWKTCGIKETCSLKHEQGSCPELTRRFFFDFRSGLCIPFLYGGCRGNENNFESQEDCQKYCGSTVDVCKLPKKEGPCRGHIISWWYNYNSKKCEKFSYGGCVGNANKFPSQEACEEKCAKRLEESSSEEFAVDEAAEEKPEPECKSRSEMGKCHAKLIRWYYEEGNGKCHKFRYGGCGGNGNNYLTEADCLKHCSKHADDDE